MSASPIDRKLVPVGFVHRASRSFGNDILDEYEYERSS